MKAIAALALAAIALLPQLPKFRARVDAVQVDALVTDGRRPVANLGPGDFELRDNGVVQKIDRCGARDVPLEIVMLLDTSSSVVGRPLAELKDAAKATIETLRPGLDRASVLSFSHQIAFATALTADRQLLTNRIDRLEAGGGTSLRDAVAAGLMLRPTIGTRRLLLVYTDALDTFSWLVPDEVLAAAHRADAVIYFVSPRPPFGSFVSDLVNATGGSYLGTANAGKIRKAFADVVQEFRNRYLLTYYPEGVERGGWHTLDVKLKGRKGQVQARRGYRAD